MTAEKFPFEKYLLDVKGEEIIWIKDRAFVIRPATEDDIERVGKGYFALEDQEQLPPPRIKSVVHYFGTR